MDKTSWTYALELYGEDGSRLQRAGVRIDWEPAVEWLRLQAVRRGIGGAEAFELECEFEPVMDDQRGAPWLAGFRGRVASATNGNAVEHVFPLDYVSNLASELSKDLTNDGRLEQGDLFTYRGLAFRAPVGAVQGDSMTTETGGRRFSTRPLSPEVPVIPGQITDRLGHATRVGSADSRDIPVLVPEAVLGQAANLARDAGPFETGGILIGHLRQDLPEGEAFVEVTAQVPATDAKAERDRLSFSPEVWTAVTAAIDLRGAAESWVGWWHSHPVHEFCKDCAPERQKACPFREDFLSSHDRLLHRTVFPRAYCTALVVNELGEEGSTFSLFGYRDGHLEPRGYHVLHHGR